MPSHFTLPVEAWNAINTLGLLGIGVLAYLNHRKASVAIHEVKKAVDGPLSQKIEEVATLSRRIATITGVPADDTAAAAAESVQADRSAGKEHRARD